MSLPIASVPTTPDRGWRVRWRGASLSAKLMLVTALAAMPAMLILVAVIGYLTYRDNLETFETELAIQARVAAENVSAAVFFDNRVEANELLNVLFSTTRVSEVAVFNAKGERVAGFRATPGPPRLSLAEEDEVGGARQVRKQATIAVRGQRAGQVVLAAPIEHIRERAIQYWQRALLLFFGTCALGYAAMRSMVPRVLAPASRLALLVEDVSQRRDYAVRAQVHSSDEIGRLAASFNDMLGRIHTHEQDLQRELAERARTEMRLAELASVDSVTGLSNRYFFQERLKEAIARSDRGGRGFAILFFDLDNFKVVNDSRGHIAGDQLLRLFGERLRAQLRTADVVCRLGGDEFAVLLENADQPESLERIATKFVSAAAGQLSVDGLEVAVTASIGIATYPGSGRNCEELLRNADTAMYAAKRAGKNTFALFTAGMLEAAERRFAVESGLRRAVERGELHLVYQPILDLATSEIVKVEALLRWHADGRVIAPDEFMTVAEETGLIVPIGNWVVQQACHDCRLWRAGGLDIEVTVNVSGRQLTQYAFVETVMSALHANALDTAALHLEITESILVSSVTEARRTLDRLSWHGVRILIDDFGTGYSSLAYLSRLAVNGLKIDRSLIDGLPENKEHLAITNAVLGMARGLGVVVVAEGVETVRQAATLRDAGCQFAQGFLYSRPVAADLIPGLVRSRHTTRSGRVADVISIVPNRDVDAG